MRHSGSIRRSARALGAGLAFGAALALGACAVAAAPIWAEEEVSTPYGDYLAARWADALSAPEEAARFYRRALEKAPDNAMLLEEAFNASLLAADWDQAPDLAARLLELDPEHEEARMALAVEAMAHRRWRRAEALLDGGGFGPLETITSAIMLAWTREARGDQDGALASLDNAGDPALLSALVSLHEAMIIGASGGDAEAAGRRFRQAQEAYALPAYAVREYGRWLERQGAEEAAADLYRARLAAQATDRVTAVELARLSAGDRAARPDAREATALGLYGAAAALMNGDDPDRLQLYLELALRLDPEFAPARLLLGQLLISRGRFDRAREMFAGLSDDQAFGLEAQVRLAQLAAAQGDEVGAIAMLETLWSETGDEEAARALAEALREAERWAEAEALLTGLVEARAASGQPGDWRLLFGRAVTRERQDEWAGAEEDFRAAIALNPNNPTLLNYLGYAMVDRGENLDEGLQMIRRAVAMAPRQGFIVDSLGWAHYRLGDYEEAVTHLERAAALAPGEADINDHLGDAYWRVGRRLEARFQWERALSLDPEPDLRAAVEAKLDTGLPPPEEAPDLAQNR